MSIKKGEIVELDIRALAFGGRGIGRKDGFVVFVRNTAVGDRVRARVFKKRKGFGEAEIVEILSPSPDRVEPPCPYSGYCGGCQWQHIRYERQIHYKREHVLEALSRIGGIHGVTVHPTIPSSRTFGYRNKMEFSFSDRRWFLPHQLDGKGRGEYFALGLHVPGVFYKVIDVEACLLQGRRGNELLGRVRDFAESSGLPVYGLKTHRGFWRYLVLRYSDALDQWMVNLVTSENNPAVLEPLAETLCREFGRSVTVVNNINRGKASVAVGQEEVVLCGSGALEDRIGPFSFRISANSFFQTNTPGAEVLYRKVVDYAELRPNDRVLDLYCGTGTIAIFVSRRVRRVTGLEISASAVADAEKNCLANGVENCLFVPGDIRETLGTLTERPDVLIIDPPRAGMHKDVLRRVRDLGAPRLVYVSCNPATMARDLEELAGVYEPLEIQPVDLFPHTYHIEAVARLQLR
ncbi:MAG: 23S rRNA (uracil(1939)-C(5))-methyltransferase RlmD [Deltaproteobacteria bacterium]|nr:23S rRNA (uracil(1939)-C(5))-methyltransferase RlmD [Deltaproteobacteria bacterium]